MPKNKLNGIAGWLIVYVIFLSIRLILGIFALAVFWQVNVITVTEFLFIAAALISLFTKFHTKQVNIVYLALSILFTLLAYSGDITSNEIQDRANGAGAVIGAAAASIAWIIYWVNSKRVRNTFVN